MAYTYDNFVSAATAAGMMDSFTEDDLNLARTNPEFGLSLVKLRQDANNATTTEQKLLAEEAQKQLRKVYSTGSSTGGGSFVFDRQKELDNLTDKAVNQGPFSYDPKTDPSAAAVRKQYLREAERSRESTMARASAGTGGAPSSYAVTAAQQAGDYHLTQLADRQQDLEQTAYQRYLQNYQKTLSDIGLLADQKQFDYAAYLQQQEQEREGLKNAMAIYNTYGTSLTADQYRDMFSRMGYLTPGVESWLEAMGSRKTYSGSPGTEGLTLDAQIALAKQLRMAQAALDVQKKMNGRPLTAGDLMWYRNS